MKNLFLTGILFCLSGVKGQNLNDKKFYAQIRHSCIATTNGALDRYTFIVLEFKNNKLYPSYLEIPSKKETKEGPVNYRFENKILYLAKPMELDEDPGLIFKYDNGNLVPQKKKGELGLVFRPSLHYYFKKNK
ncbi:hypothetical protein [Chryseobacterium sp. 2987]|uniref:hypothetical protein n=1 Tax=Chryseobacterium sp. 2987 TaxID=2817767 RepID=UPI0028657CBE|nr:hypothetical protein [Chryseobacterium sp. 2987]MDR6923888.1 hypothetical protein [Chryseobacterium sp. 2987]